MGFFTPKYGVSLTVDVVFVILGEVLPWEKIPQERAKWNTGHIGVLRSLMSRGIPKGHAAQFFTPKKRGFRKTDSVCHVELAIA